MLQSISDSVWSLSSTLKFYALEMRVGETQAMLNTDQETPPPKKVSLSFSRGCPQLSTVLCATVWGISVGGWEDSWSQILSQCTTRPWHHAGEAIQGVLQKLPDIYLAGSCGEVSLGGFLPAAGTAKPPKTTWEQPQNLCLSKRCLSKNPFGICLFVFSLMSSLGDLSATSWLI